MTYYYTYSHNDNGRIRNVTKTFDSREEMEKFLETNNLPHPQTAFEALNDFFGTHRRFMDYLRDVFPSIALPSQKEKTNTDRQSRRFSFDEYEEAVKSLTDRTQQKQELEADLAKLMEYEKVFKDHGHKDMLKKVQKDIEQAKDALAKLG